ncbi:MAG: M20 family metallopeptidase [Turicibacter sp.]|nr:M20 family metallopeptidase [Turicibacter sp.]
MLERVKELVEEIYPQLVSIRRDFHQYPELGLEEFRTSSQIAGYLSQWNIPIVQKIRETSLVGLIQGNGPGKTIGLRADIDALPILEKHVTDYISRHPGIMHACGHDAHTTILLGTAYILNELRHEFNGNVKLFFQQAEESVGGAEAMIEAGCLKNPDVSHVLGLHVCPNLQVGEVSFNYGQSYASSDTVIIDVYGKQAHGAYPQGGIDSILMTGQIMTALQSLISRNLSPFESVVLSFGQINGGTAANIIADHVRLIGTLRTLDKKTRSFLKRRIEEVSENVARAMGGNAVVTYEPGYLPLVNNDRMVDHVRQVATEVLGPERVIINKYPSLGVEDFSYFAEALPSCFYRIGVANPAKGFTSTLHENTFDLDEEALKVGVIIQVMSTLGLLK